MANCFVIMPISMPDIYYDRYGDSDHFEHVLDYLFVPALEAAGYEAVPPTAVGSDVIHAEIIRNLETCDMVLCDISTLNPNVFFELGIRTSLDRPAILVRDNFTVGIPFDTGSINTFTYDSSLQPWKIPSEVTALTVHIQRAAAKSEGRNSLWRYFGLTQRATPAEIGDPVNAKLDLVIDELARLKERSQYTPNLQLLAVNPSEPTSSSEPILTGMQYEREVIAAIRRIGYDVKDATRVAGSFDLLIEREDGYMVAAELKYSRRPLTANSIIPILYQASESELSVLLIANTELSVSAQASVNRHPTIEIVRWRDQTDDDRLATALHDMFPQNSSNPDTATSG